MVVAVAGYDPRPADAGDTGSVHRHRYLPENHRDLWRLRGIRAQDDDLVGRHLRQRGHTAAEDGAPLLSAQLDARRGGGDFNEAIPNNQVNCPGNNWGSGVYRANPVPSTQLVNRMRVALRNWVMIGTPPPASRWPTLIGQNLVDPTKAAMGFPSIPNASYMSLSGIGVPDSVFLPDNFIFPILDYDWGPDYDHSDASGVPTNAPPPIKHVIPMKVPRVDADGNEIGGVPTVLRDAPLGTYLGWNLTANLAASPFHAGQVCNYVGGMIPFAKTKAQRIAAGDPRLSLEERYGTHAGYVAAVKAAADNAACQGYLLAGADAASDGSMPKCPGTVPAGFPNDWKVLVEQAIASNVCNQPGDGGVCAP